MLHRKCPLLGQADICSAPAHVRFMPLADIAQTVLSKRKDRLAAYDSLGLAILVYGGVFRSITRPTLKRALDHLRHQRRDTYKCHRPAASEAAWPFDQ